MLIGGRADDGQVQSIDVEGDVRAGDELLQAGDQRGRGLFRELVDMQQGRPLGSAAGSELFHRFLEHRVLLGARPGDQLVVLGVDHQLGAGHELLEPGGQRGGGHQLPRFGRLIADRALD